MQRHSRSPSILTTVAVALLALGGMSAAGADEVAAEPVRISDIPWFLDQQRDIRDEMLRGRKFKHVADSDKNRLYRAQDEIFVLLDGRDSVDELNNDDLVALYNAQEVVNAVIADAELDRPICKRETIVGTHRKQTVCLTVRERNQIALGSRMNRLRNRTCNPRPQQASAAPNCLAD